MDKKTFSIGVLSITAAILFIAQFLPVRSAEAATTASGNQFQMVTARVQAGGEGLYVVDNRTGLMGVFIWDSNSRRVQLRAVRNVADAFAER
ncbi:MAG TPA: hypothetical protein VL282_18570 [Tepidisphaeraceae bacterium]|jgi:hypothetical protein|nr:hypothetical protein [Tepidisphaeraceae bacterium]